MLYCGYFIHVEPSSYSYELMISAADVTSKPVYSLPLSASITPAGTDESLSEMIVTMEINGVIR